MSEEGRQAEGEGRGGPFEKPLQGAGEWTGSPKTDFRGKDEQGRSSPCLSLGTYLLKVGHLPERGVLHRGQVLPQQGGPGVVHFPSALLKANKEAAAKGVWDTLQRACRLSQNSRRRASPGKGSGSSKPVGAPGADPGGRARTWTAPSESEGERCTPASCENPGGTGKKERRALEGMMETSKFTQRTEECPFPSRATPGPGGRPLKPSVGRVRSDKRPL